MARGNIPLVSFNRGLVSPKAMARVDLDRMRLSASKMTNWLPKTQGAMRIRPGTKYLGSSRNDTGAEWIEFVAATDDTALLELTHQKMRVWLPSDTGHGTFETPVSTGLEVPMSRPKVDTTVTLSDTGWANTSTGGAFATASVDVIPTMTTYTVNGVTVSAETEWSTSSSGLAWFAAEDNLDRAWYDTGVPSTPSTALPSWWKVDFGAGNTKAITSYSVRAHGPGSISNAPAAWTLQYNDVDTGTGWTTVDSRSAQNAWGAYEKRMFTRLDADTGTVEAFRYWRINYTATNGALELGVSEHEFFTAATAQQVKIQSGTVGFNATSIGARARREKRVMVSDTGTEHSLAITVDRGPIVLRCGSSQRDDDYISETSLGTGYHNLAFTPSGNFWITLQHDGLIDRIVSSLTIGDSGTVEITTPWGVNDLQNVRYDQSADVVYVDCDGVEPHKIERRGTGRSWSVVDYAPDDGPFLPAASSSAKLSVSHFFGNTTMNSDVPFFTSGHVGALMRAFHHGQSGQWRLGALDAATDAIEVTGICDTGTPNTNNERRVAFSVTGTYTGNIKIERSFDGPDKGFKDANSDFGASTSSDTGTFSRNLDDRDDNIKVWYRARMSSYTSGVAVVNITYGNGGITGVGRITGFNSNTAVSLEVLSRFSDTGTTDNWQQGFWSANRGYPTAVALHGGRLSHAQGGNLFLSVADDYETFDDETVGDAGPIVRALGSGPVDQINYLISLLRLIVGTAGAEISMRSSSLDEPLTPDNSSAKTFSTQGSANIRALKMDTSGIFVQRSGQRLFQVGFGQGVDALGDYEVSELTILVPDFLEAGVVSIAIQRQPDTRIHCVLANGKVGILTYEPKEEVLCWSMWETDGAVEKASVLPGIGEDKIYYHVNRTINGATKRYLEKWATESESEGDTGLSWLADCAKSFTDTGRATSLTGFTHLAAKAAVVWGDDTGQSYPSKDYSADTGPDAQKTYTVSGAGVVTLTEAAHHAVVGLPYTADWTSTKLAYAAEAGTALAQMKRVDKIAFVLYNTHNNGLFFGNDTGTLDPLPRRTDGGATVDTRKIFSTFDQVSMPFPGLWDADSRIHLRAKAPRPATVLAAIPTVGTNEEI